MVTAKTSTSRFPSYHPVHNAAIGDPPLWTHPVHRRLPLTHPLRIARHDAKLWHREKARAAAYGISNMRCPCNICVGFHRRGVAGIGRHLQIHGRHPAHRIWNSPNEYDSSDEEWKADYDRSTHARLEEYDSHIGDGPSHGVPLDVPVDVPPTPVAADDGIDVHHMMQDIFTIIDAAADDAHEAEMHQPPVGEAADNGQDFEEGRFMFGAPEERNAARTPLFPGSKVSKLAFVVMFMNICGNHNCPKVLQSELLTFLHKTVLPDGNLVPKNNYEANKMITNLGMSYTSYHVCPDSHVLFRKEHKDDLTCYKCGKHRYQSGGRSKVPAKVFRYFDIESRLLRMLGCPGISEHMTWTADNQSQDGKQRHIGDSVHWKNINEKYPDFAEEPRNVRFGLSLDGMNPFGDKNNVYSCWPVTLLNYNLPPWLTTKRFFIMLSMMIPGPKSALASNIDVYLAPLVEELKTLWDNGLVVNDAFQRPGRPSKFKLRAMLILTVADYPAHGMISGQATHGRFACTRCGPRVNSEHCKSLGCFKFLGHRRWLPLGHPYRQRPNQLRHFGNVSEIRGPPQRVTSAEVVAEGILKAAYDRQGGIDGGVNDPAKKSGIKRQTLLDMQLPYWQVQIY
jgi:hypothetical protein